MAIAPPRAVITRNEAMSDAFDRANGPLGRLDTGQPWTALTANPSEVVSLQAKKLTGGSMYDFTGTGASEDFDVEAVVGGAFCYGGLFGRARDENNCYLLQTLVVVPSATYILLRSAGNWAVLGSFSGAVNIGDTLRFTGRGTNLAAYVNGALAIVVSEATLTAPGSCGLCAYSLNFTHDAFVARGPGAPPRAAIASARNVAALR